MAQHAHIDLKNFDPENLTDRELFDVCQRIGAFALKARRKFVGLLPLIERRRIYRGHGLYSIYDFAAKLGGVGREVVNEVLRIDGYLSDTPTLRKKLYCGEIGWTKIRSIVHIIGMANEATWIEKLETLSRIALETYVREYKMQTINDATPLLLELSDRHVGMAPDVMQGNALTSVDTNKNTSHFTISIAKTTANEAKFLPGKELELNGISASMQSTTQPNGPQYEDKNESPTDRQDENIFENLAQQRETFTFSMNRAMASRLRLFRQKLEKEKKTLITWEEVMEEFLKRADNTTNNTTDDAIDSKTNNAASSTTNATGRIVTDANAAQEKPATRHIPNATKREISQRYGGLCAFTDCGKPAEILHHTRRFALTKNLTRTETHDPRFIKPLCKAHERIAHATLIAREESNNTHDWRMLDAPDTGSEKYKIDQSVNSYRKPK